MPYPQTVCRRCGAVCVDYGAYMVDENGNSHCPKPYTWSQRLKQPPLHMPTEEEIHRRQNQASKYARLRREGLSAEESENEVYGPEGHPYTKNAKGEEKGYII